MKYELVGQLVDRWVNDKEFRKAMRLNAEQAVRQSGIPLAPEEWKVLSHGVDWSLSDEQLNARISKWFA